MGLSTTPTIAIIIPALNEGEALKTMLPRLSAYQPNWIIVVDNNSSDNTADVAGAAGALVAREQQQGYGYACWRGFHEAQKLGAEILVFMDGDGSDDPADLPLMLAPLLKKKAELVVGSRVSSRSEHGAVPPQARLGNWMVSRLIGLVYRVSLHDIGSFRALRTTTLHELDMQEMTFGWPVEMLIKTARAGYRITEIDIHYRCRTHGQSKVSGTLTGSIKAACHMLRTTVRYTRLGRRYV